MEYKIPFPKSLFQDYYFGPAVFIILFLGLFFYIWKKGKEDFNYKIIFFGLGWFLIWLIPYINVIFILNAPFAEHWLYVPEMGLILAISYFLFYLARNKMYIRKIIVILILITGIFYSWLTIKQNMIWKDGITLYNHIIRYAPDSSKAYNNLGLIYANQGDLLKAEELLEKAVKIDSRYVTAVENLEWVRSEIRKRHLLEKQR